MTFRKIRLFIGLIVALTNSPFEALANGVSESNYQHIKQEHAIVVDKLFPAASLHGKVHTFDGVQIGARLALGRDGQIEFSAGSQKLATVSFLFDEDVCEFGAFVAIDGRNLSNSVKIVFSFVARDGTQIDQETRWPASGTTLQSFSSDSFVSRFAAVEISAAPESRLTISMMLAQNCSFAVS